MDDFTKGIGTKLMLLLWHGATVCRGRSRPSRLITRIVDGLRGDSFGHEGELVEIANEFAREFRGTPDQDLAARFASDLLSAVGGGGDAGEFLLHVDVSMRTVPKLRLSAAAMRIRKADVWRKRRRALGLLQRIRRETARQIEGRKVEPTASPNRRPARRPTIRTRRRGGGR